MSSQTFTVLDDLKRWEFLLVGLCLTVLGLTAGFLAGGVTFKDLLGIQDITHRTRVGLVHEHSGELKRLLFGQTLFSSIDRGTVLYHHDTVMTSDRGSAEMVLNDGTVILLGPSTMIRLVFDLDYSINGVAVLPRIQMARGNIEVRPVKQRAVIETATEKVSLTSGADQTIKHVVALTPKGIDLESKPVKPVESLKLLQPLVGGKEIETNQIEDSELQNFEVTFRWHPIEGAREYRLKAGDVTDVSLKESRYTASEFRLFDGKIPYQVTATLENGQEVTTASDFRFRFLPPRLVKPDSKSVVFGQLEGRHIQLEDGKSRVLTWSRTHFTNAYWVQVSRDSNFLEIVSEQRITQNFYVLPSVQPGSYWWRVKSIGEGIESPFSEPRLLEFKVRP